MSLALKKTTKVDMPLKRKGKFTFVKMNKQKLTLKKEHFQYQIQSNF